MTTAMDDSVLRDMEDIAMGRDPSCTVTVCERRLARDRDILRLCTGSWATEQEARAEFADIMRKPHWRPML